MVFPNIFCVHWRIEIWKLNFLFLSLFHSKKMKILMVAKKSIFSRNKNIILVIFQLLNRFDDVIFGSVGSSNSALKKFGRCRDRTLDLSNLKTKKYLGIFGRCILKDFRVPSTTNFFYRGNVYDPIA